MTKIIHTNMNDEEFDKFMRKNDRINKIQERLIVFFTLCILIPTAISFVVVLQKESNRHEDVIEKNIKLQNQRDSLIKEINILELIK